MAWGTPSQTGPAEQCAGRADFFSTIGDIELLGGAERGWFFSEGVRKVMTAQEALFVPTFSWPHREAAADYFGVPVFDCVTGKVMTQFTLSIGCHLHSSQVAKGLTLILKTNRVAGLHNLPHLRRVSRRKTD